MAAHKKLHRRKSVNVRLPPYLTHWLIRQKETQSELIETALNSYYQIPEYLKGANICPSCGMGEIEEIKGIIICSHCTTDIQAH